MCYLDTYSSCGDSDFPSEEHPAQQGMPLPFLARLLVCAWLFTVSLHRKSALVRSQMFPSLRFTLLCGVCCYMGLIFNVVSWVY